MVRAAVIRDDAQPGRAALGDRRDEVLRVTAEAKAAAHHATVDANPTAANPAACAAAPGKDIHSDTAAAAAAAALTVEGLQHPHFN